MDEDEARATPAVAALPPHDDLNRYYAPRQKASFVRRMFDRTAGDYDRIERLMALGTGRRYRREALLRAGIKPGMRVLDVAAGTGAVAREAMSIVKDSTGVIGIDPSGGMLTQLRRELPIRVAQATGEALPFADGKFDFLSVGYALRHLSDLSAALLEFARVLKPGGVVCLLEITAPDRPLPRLLAEAYFKAVVPCVSRLVATHPDTQLLWRYYWDTIDSCIPPDRVLRAMTDAGFDAGRRHVELGIFSEYTATRAASDEVHLVRYDPQWPDAFRDEASRLRAFFGNTMVLRTEHVGSTAIPGMSAKSVIDMLVEIPSFESAMRVIRPKLQQDGCEYIWRDDRPPGHMMFIRHDAAGRRTHHVHMAPAGHPLWERVAFRDYLRMDTQEARRYEQLKTHLAAVHSHDREAYTDAKGEYVKRITARAVQHFASAADHV